MLKSTLTSVLKEMNIPHTLYYNPGLLLYLLDQF